MDLELVIDKYGLSRPHVFHKLKTQVVEAGTFGGKGIHRPRRRVAAAQHQRPDAQRVGEGQQAVPGNDGNGGVGALHQLLGGFHGVEDVHYRQAVEVFHAQLRSEGVHDKLQVVGGFGQHVVVLVQAPGHVAEVDDVAVVHHGQPEGVAGQEGLGQLGGVGTLV